MSMRGTAYARPVAISDVDARQLEGAIAAVSRLDERIHRDPAGPGFLERQHYQEACATLYAGGELVHLEDLVLADHEASVRLTTIELTRARQVLQARRTAIVQPAAWVSSDEAIFGDRQGRGHGSWSDEPDRDEDARLDDWREVMDQTTKLPAMLAAAVAWDAWRAIDPIMRGQWRAGLVAAGVLRARGLTRHHLAAICIGGRHGKYRPASYHRQAERLAGFLEWITAAAAAGETELNRLSLARQVLAEKAADRHVDSRLPALIELFLSRPLVTANMAMDQLQLSRRGFTLLRQELGASIREFSGRRSYRTWGIL